MSIKKKNFPTTFKGPSDLLKIWDFHNKDDLSALFVDTQAGKDPDDL
jgi:hypothetical protein